MRSLSPRHRSHTVPAPIRSHHDQSTDFGRNSNHVAKGVHDRLDLNEAIQGTLLHGSVLPFLQQESVVGVQLGIASLHLVEIDDGRDTSTIVVPPVGGLIRAHEVDVDAGTSIRQGLQWKAERLVDQFVDLTRVKTPNRRKAFLDLVTVNDMVAQGASLHGPMNFGQGVPLAEFVDRLQEGLTFFRGKEIVDDLIADAL